MKNFTIILLSILFISSCNTKQEDAKDKNLIASNGKIAAELDLDKNLCKI